MKRYLLITTLICLPGLAAAGPFGLPDHQPNGYRDTKCLEVEQKPVVGTNYFNNPTCRPIDSKTNVSKPRPGVTPLPNPEPPVDEPPVDEPPVDEPPVDEPPVDEPPVDEPPVDEPPVDEPPVDEPPHGGNPCGGNCGVGNGNGGGNGTSNEGNGKGPKNK